MKIASTESIQLEEFPAIIWIQVKTGSGHVGLGETFFRPRAVAGCVHEMFAPMLIGKDPLASVVIGVSSTEIRGLAQTQIWFLTRENVNLLAMPSTRSTFS